MKLSTTSIALIFASACALQAPEQSHMRKAFAVATVAASAFLGVPLDAPAAPPTAIVVNIKADINPYSAAKKVFDHRRQLQTAVKDFLGDIKQLGDDLDGVFPAAPNVDISVPEDWKQAIRDALVGQARLFINDEPLYFEVDSKEGFLTVKVISPLLPKVPFLEPSDSQRASMVIPRPVAVAEDTQVAAAPAEKPFWEWSFTLPGTQLDATLPEVAAGLVASAYSTTFGYYMINNALEEKQAEEKRRENQAKAAAAKKAKAAAAAAES